jgi:hypothetical protein
LANEKRSREEEEALTRLYGAKHGDPDHAQLEKQYNDAHKERFVREGGNPDQYNYQRDVRHEFKFTESRDANNRLTETRARSAVDPNYDDGRRYSLRSPDEVINWRNTEAGAKADSNARQKVSSGTGDDAGHLISPKFGADPGCRRNISRQNFVANQSGGTFHQWENDVKADAGKRPQELDVKVRYRDDPKGEREFTRSMTVHDQDENGKPIAESERRLDFANTKTGSVRDREQGGSGSRAADRALRKDLDQARKAPDVAEQQAAWRRMGDKYRSSSELSSEERSELKREMQDRVKGGESETRKREH